MNDKNIYQKVNAVMSEISYIKKDASVQGYMAVTHDNVVATVRASLVKNGIVIVPSQVSGTLHAKGEKYDYKTKEKVPDPMRMYEATYEIKFVNMDNPEDFIAVLIESHALDNGDKAPGKALSYATKSAILKVFSIETGVNDESRVAVDAGFTDGQKNHFDEILETGDALELLAFERSAGPDTFTALYNSFEKGSIVKGKTRVDELIKEGHSIIDKYASDITELYNTKDPAISELVGELTVLEKQLVAGRLQPEVLAHLQTIGSKK